MSIGSFKTRFQVFRLVYNCIDCYRRIHDKLHGTRHADCFQFIHVNAWSSQLKVFALMLKEFLLQIPANSFSFSLYFFSFLRFEFDWMKCVVKSLIDSACISDSVAVIKQFCFNCNGWGVLRYLSDVLHHEISGGNSD